MKSWHYKILFFVQDSCVRVVNLSVGVKDTSVRVQDPNAGAVYPNVRVGGRIFWGSGS